MKTSVCIEMLYTEYPFLERFKKQPAGFAAVNSGIGITRICLLSTGCRRG